MVRDKDKKPKKMERCNVCRRRLRVGVEMVEFYVDTRRILACCDQSCWQEALSEDMVLAAWPKAWRLALGSAVVACPEGLPPKQPSGGFGIAVADSAQPAGRATFKAELPYLLWRKALLARSARCISDPNLLDGLELST